MHARSSPARPAVTALVVGLGIVLALFALGFGARLLVFLGLLVLGPGFWWRWKTREFRQGVREMRRGHGDIAASHFRRFIEMAEINGSFLRYQPFFNLGRPYHYVAAAHNNLGVLALHSGDRETACADFTAATARSPVFAPAHYGHAAVLLLDGDLDHAERAARAGLDAEPGHRPCAVLLALCHAERSDRSAAEAVLRELRKPLSFDQGRSHWAKMYQFWGAPDRATKWE